MIRQRIGTPDIEPLRQGDPQAFTALVDQYTPLVQTCGRRYGIKDHDLDDLTNQTFLQALLGLKHYRGQASLGTWLWSIASHEAVSFLRQQARQRRLYPEDTPPSLLIDDPLEQVSHRDHIQKLTQALEQLPPHWNNLIKRFYWQQATTRSIAQDLESNATQVRVALCRVRKSLRRQLCPTVS